MASFDFDSDDFFRWVSKYPRVQSPTPSGEPIRVVLTKIQRDFVKRSGAIRLGECVDVTVKPRQIGMSTLCFLMFLYLMRNVKAINIGVVGVDDLVLQALRRKFQIILSSLTKNDPGFPRVKNDNAKFCMLDNGSSLCWIEAGIQDKRSENAGRGDTMHILQFTEFAFWHNARLTMDSILPSMSRSDVSVIIDSTSNGTDGMGEEFYKFALAAHEGTPGMNLFFWPWYFDSKFRIRLNKKEEDEIRKTLNPKEKSLIKLGVDLGQIAWRRNKVVLMGDAFQKTYPETFEEAFISKNISIFSDRLIEELRLININDAWPKKINIKPYIKHDFLLKVGRNCKSMRIVLSKDNMEKGTGVWFFRNPGRREKFVIAIDGSKGIKDFQSITVTSRKDKQICAIARLKLKSLELVADVARILSMIYNNATVGVEEEISGMVIWSSLLNGIPDHYWNEETFSNMAKSPFPYLFGEGDRRGLLKIDKRVKGHIVSLLIDNLDHGDSKVVCYEMYREIISFIEHKDGSYGAKNEKEHDDILMSYGHSLVMDRCLGNTNLSNDNDTNIIKYGVIIDKHLTDNRKERLTEGRLWSAMKGRVKQDNIFDDF